MGPGVGRPVSPRCHIRHAPVTPVWATVFPVEEAQTKSTPSYRLCRDRSCPASRLLSLFVHLRSFVTFHLRLAATAVPARPGVVGHLCAAVFWSLSFPPCGSSCDRVMCELEEERRPSHPAKLFLPNRPSEPRPRCRSVPKGPAWLEGAQPFSLSGSGGRHEGQELRGRYVPSLHARVLLGAYGNEPRFFRLTSTVAGSRVTPLSV